MFCSPHRYRARLLPFIYCPGSHCHLGRTRKGLRPFVQTKERWVECKEKKKVSTSPDSRASTNRTLSSHSTLLRCEGGVFLSKSNRGMKHIVSKGEDETPPSPPSNSSSETQRPLPLSINGILILQDIVAHQYRGRFKSETSSPCISHWARSRA